MIDLEAERAAARARYEAQMAEGWARALLEKVGWTAGEEELRTAVERDWPNQDPQGVVDAARRLQEGSESRVRKLNREEIEKVAKSRTQASRDGIRKLLQHNSGLATRTIYERLTSEGVECVSFSYFNTLASEVRRELGIDGRAKMTSRMRKQGRPRAPALPDPAQEEVSTPAEPVNTECVSEEEAPADTECVSPSPNSASRKREEAQQPPPEAPQDAELADYRRSASEGTGTVDRLLDAIRRKKEQLAELERDLEELRTALRVVEQLEGEAA